MAELRRPVAQGVADLDAVLVLDGSAFAKSGAGYCGVARPWCGRPGEVENCQVGVIPTSGTARGYAPLDRRLSLPREWAERSRPREACHALQGVTFQERWRSGPGLLDRCRGDVPCGRVAGGDEFGRASAFRARRLRYVFGVPANTLLRDPGEGPAPGGAYRPGGGWTNGRKRNRMRLIVRTDGTSVPPWSSRAWRMARAPTAPRSPWAGSFRAART